MFSLMVPTDCKVAIYSASSLAKGFQYTTHCYASLPLIWEACCIGNPWPAKMRVCQHEKSLFFQENVLNEDQNGVLDWNSTIGKETQTGCMILFCRCLLGNFRFRYNMVKSADAANGNSVSSIDILSRYIFPLSFCLFQAFYWAWYLRFKLS